MPVRDTLADAEFLAETLRELFDEAFPHDGVFGSLNQLLTRAARAAALTPLDGADAESAACAIEETADSWASSHRWSTPSCAPERTARPT